MADHRLRRIAEGYNVIHVENGECIGVVKRDKRTYDHKVKQGGRSVRTGGSTTITRWHAFLRGHPLSRDIGTFKPVIDRGLSTFNRRADAVEFLISAHKELIEENGGRLRRPRTRPREK